MAIGAGETTVLRMTTAYAFIANGGKKIVPTLIDRIQDRYGNTIYKHDDRICEGCVAENWSNQAEPTLIDNAEQILDPMTAYQITSMMEGVVKYGTGRKALEIGKPIAGKTGTTNDSRTSGSSASRRTSSPACCRLRPARPMGKGVAGGVVAAPIFTDFMKDALADKPPVDFRVPDGIKLVPVNHLTGQPASGSGAGIVIEAFKPGTAPGESGFSFVSGASAQPDKATAEQEKAVYSGTGGLY